jgi:hypothetical protein
VAAARVILVAEDNEHDLVLLRCAFESAELPHRLIGVGNGAMRSVIYTRKNPSQTARLTHFRN